MSEDRPAPDPVHGPTGELDLGAFSVSLSVKDLEASRQFYQSLGFEVTSGRGSDHYLILRNGDTMIGLFHGMFEGNVLTFNPGMDRRGETVDQWTDVRDIADRLQAEGLHLTTPLDPEAGDSGPAHIALIDPDGNAVLIDQHL
jgi:catechol 2,3-dioxygenase-like lactoylglutathione lyase family enzyme